MSGTRKLIGHTPKHKPLENTKYVRFWNYYFNIRYDLLDYFLKNVKRDHADSMPCDRGHMEYIRYGKAYDKNTDNYNATMRDNRIPLINFNFLNNIIHLFKCGGNNEKYKATYGYYDYANGKLDYNLEYKKRFKENLDGTYLYTNDHLNRIKGSGTLKTRTDSPIGLYDVKTGIHPKVKDAPYQFDQVFYPEATINDAQNNIVRTIRIKGNDQIQRFQLPLVSGGNNDNNLRRFEENIMRAIQGEEPCALFLAFLLLFKENRIEPFSIWKNNLFNGLWELTFITAAEKRIIEFEHEQYIKQQMSGHEHQVVVKKDKEPHDISNIPGTNYTRRDNPEWDKIYDKLYNQDDNDDDYNDDDLMLSDSIHYDIQNIINECINKYLRKNLFNYNTL